MRAEPIWLMRMSNPSAVAASDEACVSTMLPPYVAHMRYPVDMTWVAARVSCRFCGMIETTDAFLNACIQAK